MKERLVAVVGLSALALAGCAQEPVAESEPTVTTVTKTKEQVTPESEAPPAPQEDVEESAPEAEPAQGVTLTGAGNVTVPIAGHDISCDVSSRSISCATEALGLSLSAEQMALQGGYPAVNLYFQPGDQPEISGRNDARAAALGTIPDEALSTVGAYQIDTTGEQATFSRGGQTYLLAPGIAEKIADGAGDVGSGSEFTARPASDNTSDAFAQAVLQAWLDAGQPNFGVISAYSPITGQTYEMECKLTHNGLNYCQGGNNALVNIYRTEDLR